MIHQLKGLIAVHIEALRSADEIADESDLAALGLDSMSALNLLFDIEEEFSVEFPEEYLTAEVFSTPNSLASAIRRLSA